jgi:hypothetical protein
MQVKAKAIGFLLGLLLCGLVNFADYQSVYYSLPFCLDCFLSFGVPFTMCGTGGFATVTKFFWGGLTANIFVWFVFSFGLAQLSSNIVNRFRKAPFQQS